MANTEIIIRKNQTFKAKELNSAVVSFDKFFSGIQKNWKDACILMHRLQDGKKYEEDGFKSIADFAETIGIEKSTAHKMCDAGMVYDSKNPVIAQFATDAGYTKANKVASLVKDGKEEELAKAIEDGEISADDTVSDLTAWKETKRLQDKKEKVLSKFEVWGVHGNGNQFHYDAVELENIEELNKCVKVGAFNMIRDYDTEGNKISEDGDRWIVYANTDSGMMLRIRYEKVKKEPKAKATKPAKEMTKEELIALAESMGMKVSF